MGVAEILAVAEAEALGLKIIVASGVTEILVETQAERAIRARTTPQIISSLL